MGALSIGGLFFCLNTIMQRAGCVGVASLATFWLSGCGSGSGSSCDPIEMEIPDPTNPGSSIQAIVTVDLYGRPSSCCQSIADTLNGGGGTPPSEYKTNDPITLDVSVNGGSCKDPCQIASQSGMTISIAGTSKQSKCCSEWKSQEASDACQVGPDEPLCVIVHVESQSVAASMNISAAFAPSVARMQPFVSSFTTPEVQI